MSARTDKILAESKAQKISYSRNPVADTTELVRRWAEVRDAEVADCLAALDGVRYYVDPQASGGSGLETYPGKWRVVANQDARLREDQEQKQGIFQTLRLGLATDVQWDEAMFYAGESLMSNTSSVDGLTGSESASTNEVYRTIRFPNIDPFYVDAIVASLTSSETFTNPIVGNVSLSGSWANLGASHKEIEDGSHVIDIVLARSQYTVNAYSAQGTYKQEGVHYLWNVPKPDVQGLLDAWSSLHPVGSSSRVSYSTNQKTADLVLSVRAFFTGIALPSVVLEESCEFVEIADYYFGLLKDDALAVQTPEHTVGATYAKRISDNGDGSYDVIITARLRQYQSTGEFVAQQDASRVVTRRVESGVGVEGHEEAVGSIANLQEGQSGQQNIDVLSDCSKRVATDIETVQNQTQTVSNITASVATTVTRDSALGSSETAAVAQPPVPAAGEAKTVDISPHPKFKDVFEVSQTTEVVANQTQRTSEVAASTVSTVVRDTALDAASATALGESPVPQAGEYRALDIAPHPKFKDVFEVRQVTEEVVNQTREVTDVSASVTSRVTQDTALDLASKELLDAGPLVNAGEARSLDITPHPRFKDVFEVRQTTETVANQTSVIRDVTAATTTERQTDTAMSQFDKAAIEAGPTAGEGEAKSLSITPHPKFKDVFEVAQTTETVVNQVRNVYDVAAAVTTEQRNDTAMALADKNALDLPPSPAAGEAKSTTVTPHPKFKDVFEVVRTTETAVDQQQTVSDINAAVHTTQTRNTAMPAATAAAVSTTPASGETRSVEITPHPKFKDVCEVRQVTEVAQNQTNTETSVSATRVTTQTVQTQMDTGSLPATPTATTGQVDSLTVEPTRFPDRARVTVTTTVGQKVEKEITWTDAEGEHYEYTGLNLTSEEVTAKLNDVADASVRADVGCSPTEFPGLFNLTIRHNPDNVRNASNADYDSIGEFIEHWYGKEDSREYCKVTLYTTSKEAAQDFVNGNRGSGTFGTIAQVNTYLISGDAPKVNWTEGSQVVDTYLQRNRGNGRYIAYRTQRRNTSGA